MTLPALYLAVVAVCESGPFVRSEPSAHLHGFWVSPFRPGPGRIGTGRNLREKTENGRAGEVRNEKAESRN